MEEVFSKLDWTYIVAVVLFSYLTLKYLVINPFTWMKITTHLLIGVALGVVWVLTEAATVAIIVFSFPFTVLLYSWVIKNVMSMSKDSYNNGKGIL